MKAYKLILTVAIAALVIQTPLVTADTFVTKDDGVARTWNAEESWTRTVGNTNLYPQDGDTATIQDGDTIWVSTTEQLDHLTIEEGVTKGLLDIRASGTLRIDDSLTMQSGANQDGEINFSATSPPAGILQIGSDMTVVGPTIKVTHFGFEVNTIRHPHARIN